MRRNRPADRQANPSRQLPADGQVAQIEYPGDAPGEDDLRSAMPAWPVATRYPHRPAAAV
jgi:hypothetical protein